MRPLLNFALAWIVPRDHFIKLHHVLARDVPGFEKTVTGKRGRAAHPLWSNGYIENTVLTVLDSNLCCGHLYEYALIMDRCVKSFEDKLQQKEGFLLDAQHTVGLRPSRTRRLYAWQA